MSEEMKYICTPLSVTEKEAFTDASNEELRALIAIIESNGRSSDPESLSKRAKISRARAASAIVFWEEAGVIRRDDGTPTITEEFEERLAIGELREESSKDIANTIRSESLAEMISECARLMNRAALNTSEIKQLTELYKQYSLSEEYILTLAAYLSAGGEKKLTVTTLVNKATKYATEYEIDDLASLSDFIKQRESECAAEKEFRKLLGIFNRALSKTEKEHFKIWSIDYGYFIDVVGEAYDIAIMNGAQRIISYMHKLLTRWHETGCKTVAECRERYDTDNEEKKKQKKDAKTSRPEKKKERYGDFDVEDAFLKALQRNYGPDETGEI